MKLITIHHISFLGSFLKEPPPFKNTDGNLLPEVAFIGRSNVGKSTLINTLCHRKDLARVSSKPGKTKTLNFFSVEESFILVDLPGYGFSRTTKEDKALWAEAIDEYLKNRKELKVVFLLLDARRELTVLDKQFLSFAKNFTWHIHLIFTKTDEVKKSQLPQAIEKNHLLAQTAYGKKCPFSLFSIREPQSSKILTKVLMDYLNLR